MSTPELTMTWLYKGKPMIEAPEGMCGFIYIITHLPSDQFYIGRKTLKRKTKRPINGKKKIIYVDSDWMDYYSSSPRLLDLIKEDGKLKFKREILTFVPTNGALIYAEELALYLSGALERDDCINGNIWSQCGPSCCYGT